MDGTDAYVAWKIVEGASDVTSLLVSWCLHNNQKCSDSGKLTPDEKDYTITVLTGDTFYDICVTAQHKDGNQTDCAQVSVSWHFVQMALQVLHGGEIFSSCVH